MIFFHLFSKNFYYMCITQLKTKFIPSTKITLRVKVKDRSQGHLIELGCLIHFAPGKK